MWLWSGVLKIEIGWTLRCLAKEKSIKFPSASESRSLWCWLPKSSEILSETPEASGWGKVITLIPAPLFLDESCLFPSTWDSWTWSGLTFFFFFFASFPLSLWQSGPSQMHGFFEIRGKCRWINGTSRNLGLRQPNLPMVSLSVLPSSFFSSWDRVWWNVTLRACWSQPLFEAVGCCSVILANASQ